MDQLYEMLGFINDYSISRAVSSTVLHEITLAAEEALVNIIEYSYPLQPEGIIEIVCKGIKGKKAVQIVIKDKGITFNPLQAEPLPPCKKIEESSPGGYGIYLLKELMDQVEYQRSLQGNKLSLTKYF